MTLSEFKAWFEGFTEDMEGPPNEKQWKRIQARIKAINDVKITERVIHDWWPRERDRPYRAFLAAQGANSGSTERFSLNAAGPVGNGVGAMAFAARTRPIGDSDTRVVDVVAELRALGKADAADLKAA